MTSKKDAVSAIIKKSTADHHAKLVEEHRESFGQLYKSTFPDGAPRLKEFTSATTDYRERVVALSSLAVADLKVDPEMISLVEFIYREHRFIVGHLKNLMTELEGNTYSVNKITNVLNLIISTSRGRDMPTEANERLPVLDAIPLWMELVAKTRLLHVGQLEEYLEARAAVENFYTQD
jgi:hypothetical protein